MKFQKNVFLFKSGHAYRMVLVIYVLVKYCLVFKNPHHVNSFVFPNLNSVDGFTNDQNQCKKWFTPTPDAVGRISRLIGFVLPKQKKVCMLVCNLVFSCLDFLPICHTGKNCSVDIDECESIPCQHNGTCINLIANFNCNCTTNYTGKFCESKKSSCNPNPCFNNGTCIKENNNFTCTCAPGFGGTLCENITTVGLNGSSYLNVTLEKQTFELSFEFRTTLNHGLLAADPSNKFLVFLDNGKVHLAYSETQKLSAGKAANLRNGLWHTVYVNISVDSVTLMVNN